MRNIRFLIFAPILLLLSGSVFALDFFDRLTFRGELPYTEMSNSGLKIGTTDPANKDIVNEFYIKPSFQTGYRIGAEYLLPSNESYVKFNYDQRDYNYRRSLGNVLEFGTFNGDFDTLPIFDICARAIAEYKSFDLAVGHQYVFSDTFQADAFTGIRFVSFNKHFNIAGHHEMTNDFHSIRYRSMFWGYGPEIGVNGYCRPFNIIWPTFIVGAEFTGALLHGTRDHRERLFNEVTGADTQFSELSGSEETTSAYFGTRLSLNQDVVLGRDTRFRFTAGYEAMYYGNIVKYGNMVGNFSTHGAFFSITFNPRYVWKN